MKGKYEQLKSYSNYHWRLYSEQTNVSDEQRRLAQRDDTIQSVGEGDDRFCIQFDEFEVEHLDSVEFKLMLFNETETLKAYHYASLRDLYIAAKHGNNIWFCMKLNSAEQTKFPLLHLRVKSQPSGKFRRAIGSSSSFVPDSLDDTFYNYSFKLPTITPKHARILDICPFTWNVIDEKAKELRNHHQHNEFIRRVIQRLSNHYYRETTKQLARLKKSAYIWAEIQDELLTYKPLPTEKSREQLYVTEDKLRSILDTNRSASLGDSQRREQEDTPIAYNNIVSYLFKRDLWEAKPEWKNFYIKLRILFRKGIPPQERIHLWSEISKTIYFVLTTQDRYQEFKTQASDEHHVDIQAADDIHAKSKRLYGDLKVEAEKVYIYPYQDLEDDIQYLKGTSDQRELKFETNIRNVCRTFIFWARMMNDTQTDEKNRYVTSYSRSILLLCQGLLTSQTCSYLEGRNAPEESQVFWLLISLVTYVLSNYYESGQTVLKADKINFRQPANQKVETKVVAGLTGSYLRSNISLGVRSDLLLLRLLLSANEKELYSKFDEFGISLEYYFADYLPTLFFGLFNPGLTFRIWDVIFFEGTGFNKVILTTNIISYIT